MPNKTMKTELNTTSVPVTEPSPTEWTEASRDRVLNAIATIREELPFLIDLTAEQRQVLPKMGDASFAFVSKALELALHNQEFLPRSFDVEQMQRNFALWEDMGSLLFAL